MNNYKILEKIGSGAYSVVYKAVDLSSNQLVAIKILSSVQFNLKHIL